MATKDFGDLFLVLKRNIFFSSALLSKLNLNPFYYEPYYLLRSNNSGVSAVSLLCYIYYTNTFFYIQ